LVPFYAHNETCCATPLYTNLNFAMKERFGWIEYNGQLGQDRWLTQVVYPGVEGGYFIDLGSGDGTELSNTKVLEAAGWTGLCIDPFPTNVEDRKCKILREVVHSVAGEKMLFRTAGIYGGLEAHLGNYKNAVMKADGVEFVTSTMAEIMEQNDAPPFIHYVNIDIEGGELAALQAFPFEKFGVGAWTIEHNNEEPKRTQVRRVLEANGYRLARTVRWDDWYLPKN